jgi:hypothetical protein
MGHNVNSRESQQQNPLQQSSIFRLKYYPSCRVKNPLLIFLNRYEEMSRNISKKRDRENQALAESIQNLRHLFLMNAHSDSFLNGYLLAWVGF